ncbi:MAG: HlyD family efflux transporter periplasmic adaptor subunit [Planctomycetota bacterium]
MERRDRIVRTPLRQRLEDLRGGPISAAAFLVAAFALWWLVEGAPPARRFVAVVRADEIVLRAPEGGVVAQVLVGPYERVEQGQVLCTFDGASIDAALDVARAETRRLEAEVGAESARLAAERRRIEFEGRTEQERLALEELADLRRLELDREQFRVDALEHEVELAALDVDRRRYEVRREDLGELVEPGLVPASEYAEIGARLEALEVERWRRQELLERTREAESEAAARLAERRSVASRAAELVGVDGDAVLEPLRRAVDVQVARVAQIVVSADGLVLRAPRSGRVARVVAGTGVRTVATDEIVALVPDGPVRADVYLPEPVRGRLTPGERLVLVDPADPSREYEGEVLFEAPSVDELPPRLWADARYPEHGLAYLVELPEGSPLPGTRLVARLER